MDGGSIYGGDRQRAEQMQWMCRYGSWHISETACQVCVQCEAGCAARGGRHGDVQEAKTHSAKVGDG